MIYFLLSVVLGLVIYEYMYRYVSRTGKLLNEIPGPTVLPLFGNLWNLYHLSAGTWEYGKIILSKYYPTMRMWFFTRCGVCVSNPDDLKILLTHKKNINKSPLGYDNLKPLEGADGIFLSSDNKWKERRKIVSPALRPEVLREYAKDADKHTHRFMKYFCSESKETIVDLSKIFQELTFAIISEAAMGVNIREFEDGMARKYIDAFENITRAMFYFTLKPFIPWWLTKFTSMGKTRDESMQLINKFARQIIQKRRDHHASNDFKDLLENKENNLIENDRSIGSRKKLCFLDQLLAAELRGHINEIGIVEEINTFFIAGSDTSSVTAAFTLMLLAENEAQQDLARKEVLEIMSESGGKIRSADIAKFVYLERCVKETLRLFPSGPIIGRLIEHEMEIKNYTLPVNTEVIVPILTIQRDPVLWPDPMKYDPDRFLPENSIHRHPLAWLPFSAGPRNCVGQKLGMMEVISIVANILYNFKIEPVDATKDVKIVLHITLKPKNPIRVKLIRINRD